MSRYSEELLILRQNQQKQLVAQEAVSKRSPLYKLSPFLDTTEVERMGLRIKSAGCVPYETKLPAIHSKEHYCQD